MTTPQAITVHDLNQRLAAAIAAAPDVRNVWVIGETSDMRTSSGHCYLELVEKDNNGANRSRIRAIIWASAYHELAARFAAVTGMALTSGIKIMARVSAAYHPAYGMSVNITDIDPSYTAGDALRRRAEIVQRLTAEGLIDRNRNLAWDIAPTRIAVISARGAAGFGDFVTHLFNSQEGFRFDVKLFNATMQGQQTAPTVMEALGKIAAATEKYHAVVIIRGGGATSDLAAFDNYDLARAVATFPIPVVIGIGHERDITALDYVANQRVKTPTAAAEWLLSRMRRLMDALGRAADKIYMAASARISANRELLAQASASLPGLVTAAIRTHRMALENTTAALTAAVTNNLTRAHERLERMNALTDALSPQAVLMRGFSYTTTADGTTLRNAAEAPAGTTIHTHLANGTITSTTL